MSTLEELKKQAEQRRQQEQQQAHSSAASAQQKWARLEPVMQRLDQHFKDLAETLNFLDKDLTVDFRINADITLVNLKAKNFQIIHPRHENHYLELIFQFENTGTSAQRFKVPKGPLVPKLEDTLTGNGIRHSKAAIMDGQVFRFTIRPFVRSKYHFIADIDREEIVLNIINYKSLWKQKNRFSTAQITQELLDALTRHAMREEEDYNRLIGNVLSDDARIEIREKLKKDIAKNKIHEASPEADAAPARKTLLGRFLKNKG